MLEGIVSSTVAMEDRRQIVEQIDRIMHLPELSVPAVSAPLTKPGSVNLSSVNFGYEKNTPILRDITFGVPRSGMCAIVGPSGSGKTTIAKLICRFYDPDSGIISVGGPDVKDQRTEQLMEQVSMVFQDVYLFDDTLSANIKIGNENATEEEVRWAADLAGVTEITKRLPRGWDTPVGEGGSSLSGGERQRVSIARALVKKAPIVLLDEATSALDAENEANITRTYQELRKNSTLIVIAHKLETIRKADQVIVLSKDGSIVERGTHEQLIAQSGAYKHFWDLRIQASNWKLV